MSYNTVTEMLIKTLNIVSTYLIDSADQGGPSEDLLGVVDNLLNAAKYHINTMELKAAKSLPSVDQIFHGIEINGLVVPFVGINISYSDVVLLAGMPIRSDIIYTIYYSYEDFTGGSLIPGQTVRAESGMNFDCDVADNA
jgi:hypothetical protein